MKVLVTGNNGYIGTVLTNKLINDGYEVSGLDTNFFYDCTLIDTKDKIHQIVKDVRKVVNKDLENIDAIIHLAALSNDPLGEFQKEITNIVNYSSTIRLAKMAKEMGVKRFVYASTQSLYGISKSDSELEEDTSKKNPITSYAESKWKSELELKRLASDDFIITFFRPSTVFGPSPRLRCDIVFNSFVASAFTTGSIEILSDGTPWRPVVHIDDVCSAFIAGLIAPKEIINGQAFNVGIKNGNYNVRDLAEAAAKAVPGSKLKFLNEHTDPRSYKVSFRKIFNLLGDYYNPKWNLTEGGKELVSFFKSVNFKETDFRGFKCNRLIKLKKLVNEKKINQNLLWHN
jgi:nucleoside-diphosphate-sugar epimerase